MSVPIITRNPFYPGANAIKFTNNSILDDANYLYVKNLAGDAFANIYVARCYLTTGINFTSADAGIYTSGADTHLVKLFALDSGATWGEVARWVSAAEPYFAIGNGNGVAIRTMSYIYHHDNAICNAAGLTDSGNTWNQPAGSVLLGVKMILNEQFAATSLTDIDFTIGLVGDQDGLLEPTMNGVTDAAATVYTTRGAYWDTAAEGCFWYANAATQWVIYTTAVGANLNTLTAGEIGVHFTYLDIP